MAVAKKNDSIPVPVGERVPKVAKGVMNRLKKAIDRHNEINEDEADFDHFLPDMVSRFTDYLESENEKTQKAVEPKKTRNSDKHELHAVQQSA